MFSSRRSSSSSEAASTGAGAPPPPPAAHVPDQQSSPPRSLPMCTLSSLDDVISYIEISNVYNENFTRPGHDVIDIALSDDIASGRQREILDPIIGSVSGLHMSLLISHFDSKGFVLRGFQQRHGYRIYRYTRRMAMATAPVADSAARNHHTDVDQDHQFHHHQQQRLVQLQHQLHHNRQRQELIRRQFQQLQSPPSYNLNRSW